LWRSSMQLHLGRGPSHAVCRWRVLTIFAYWEIWERKLRLIRRQPNRYLAFQVTKLFHTFTKMNCLHSGNSPEYSQTSLRGTSRSRKPISSEFFIY
jgi:hypothetical protein